MLSRVAENVYWMARYLERTEDTARLINSTSNLLLDLPRDADVEWYELIRVFGAEAQFTELHDDNREERTVMRFLITDKRNSSAIIPCIEAARENARVTRDIIPYEVWEQMNELYYFSGEYARGSVGRRKRNDFMSGLVRRCQTMTGIMMGILPHDAAYQFLRIGRNLERADMSSRVIDVAAAQLLPEEEDINPAFATVRWISVLKSLNAFKAYRQQGLVGLNGPAILDYLINNYEFPRSIGHCLGEVGGCLKDLPRPHAPRRQVNALLREMEGVRLRSLRQSGLHKLIDRFQLGVGQLHDTITNTYFRYD
jgi:uncharacterized alpha-E superfamily protein